MGVATAGRSQSPPPPNNPSALTISLGSAFDEQMDLDEWFNNTVPAFFGTLGQGATSERSLASAGTMDYEMNIEGSASAYVRDLLQPPLLPLQPNVDEDYHQQLAIDPPAFQFPAASAQAGGSGAPGLGLGFGFGLSSTRWPYPLSTAAAAAATSTSLHTRTSCARTHCTHPSGSSIILLSNRCGVELIDFVLCALPPRRLATCYRLLDCTLSYAYPGYP